MASHSLNISYEILDFNELPADEQDLLTASLEATNLAHAPFSNFFVGCALQLENGEIITGNNQENVAFPSGLCAERIALFYAGSIGKADQVRKMAIRARSANFVVAQPPTSCGACRQVMVEYEKMAGQPFVVLMQGEHGKVLRVNGVKNSLLPFSFDLDL